MLLLLLSVAFAGAQVTIDEMTVDGLSMKSLSCSLERGGLFGPMVVVAAVAGNDEALDTCAPGGAAFKASWTWKGGKTVAVDITEASDPTRANCVEEALKSVTADLEGTCTAVILVGDETAARAAALKPVP